MRKKYCYKGKGWTLNRKKWIIPLENNHTRIISANYLFLITYERKTFSSSKTLTCHQIVVIRFRRSILLLTLCQFLFGCVRISFESLCLCRKFIFNFIRIFVLTQGVSHFHRTVLTIVVFTMIINNS